MKTLSLSKLRSNIKGAIDLVSHQNQSVVVGRRNRPEVVIIKFPDLYKKEVSEITNLNAYMGSFDFLESEPNIYSAKDAQ